MEEGPPEAKVPRAHRSHHVALSLPREGRAEAKLKELLGFAWISPLPCVWSTFGHPVKLRDRPQNNSLKCLI